MSPKRRLSEDVSDSSDTDTEMPRLMPMARAPQQLMPVAMAPQQEAREPPTRASSNWAEAEALGNLTMEGLVDLAKHRPQLMESLNDYMRRRHGVWINATSEDTDGILTIVVFEKCPAPKRRCKWGGQRWTLSETLKWTLVRDATLLWTLEYWERDFEPEED